MRVTSYIAAAAALACTGTAFAEPPLGSRLGSRERPSAEKTDVANAAQKGHAAAKCMVNKRRPAAERLLTATDMETVRKAHTSLWAGELTCYSGFEDNDSGFVESRVINTPLDILRGMLAEEMVKRDEMRVRALPVLQPKAEIYVRPWYPVTGRDPIVDEMATCVAEVNPAGTFGMLGTEPYSAAERAAMGTLGVDFGRCLRAGAKLRANRQALRAALAEALYQRTQPWPVAPPQPAGVAR